MPDTYTPADPWPVRFACDVSTRSPAVTGKAVAFASDLLFQLTGQQFGLTQVTLRPCREYRRSTPFPDGWMAWPGHISQPLIGASWASGALGGAYGYFVDNLCATCSAGCGCMGAETVKLPALTHDIVQVKIDGVIVDPTTYRVDGYYLTRTDGTAWPFNNDLRYDDSHVGTWSVTGHFGQTLPVGADLAVGELACEVIKALAGEACGLPANVVTLARQGVTVNLAGRAETLRTGFTGLYLTDLFISTWNPTGSRGRARVYSVDNLMNRRIGT